MSENTPLTDVVLSADAKIKYDASCKKVLSNKRIAAAIMKGCLPECSNFTIEEIANHQIESGTIEVGTVPVGPDTPQITGLPNEDSALSEGTVTYDVRFLATIPNEKDPIQVIINLEAQNAFDPGYGLLRRAMFYCCRMVSSQKNTTFTHSHYEKIRKVYSIWVCMNPPEDKKNTITRIRPVAESVEGEAHYESSEYDILSAVMICLGDEDKAQGLLRLLGVLFDDEREAYEKLDILDNEFNIPKTEQWKSEVDIMCNLSQGVENKGVEKGILSSLRNLMKKTGWNIEQACEALGVPKNDLEKYAELLKQ